MPRIRITETSPIKIWLVFDDPKRWECLLATIEAPDKLKAKPGNWKLVKESCEEWPPGASEAEGVELNLDPPDE